MCVKIMVIAFPVIWEVDEKVEDTIADHDISNKVFTHGVNITRTSRLYPQPRKGKRNFI